MTRGGARDIGWQVMRAALLSLIVVIAGACGAPHGEGPSAPERTTAALEVRDGWAAPTPGGVDVSAGYLTIVNAAGREDRLLGATSPRAARVEVHEMSMDGGVMRMRAVEGGLVIPAGATVMLGPGGQHLMFYGVSQPFAAGERIPVTLRFAQAGDVAVELPVRRDAGGRSDH
jgi:copper(I)-binding protein